MDFFKHLIENIPLFLTIVITFMKMIGEKLSRHVRIMLAEFLLCSSKDLSSQSNIFLHFLPDGNILSGIGNM